MPPSLTLKQRLAALTASQSSSSSSATGNTRPGVSPINVNPPARGSSLKKGFFGGASSNWSSSRETLTTEGGADPYAMEKVQEVMGSVIYQAGVDYETRPIVVMNASALPDPQVVSHDILLTQVLSYLDLFVESDYTVIFFAAGCQYSPSLNWIRKAYRSLSRKYRKNLKRLLIVHTTFFYKTLFSLLGALISPKFFRKITYINTLSELATHVPLTQIDIPPAVYHENLKHEHQITLPSPVRASVFGVSLEELMGFEGEKDGLPRVVRDCITFLRETGLEEEGLFRRSPSSALLRQVQEAYDRGQTVSLRSFHDAHLAAVLLKKFLRDLPVPIFRESTYSLIRQCPNANTEEECVEYIRTTILPELTPCAYIVLNAILHLMHDVSLRSSKNLMDAHNLAVVLTPNLVSSGNPVQDVMLCMVGPSTLPVFPGQNSNGSNISKNVQMTLGTVVKICIERYYEIFDEVRDRSEALLPPIDADSEAAAHAPSPPDYDAHLDANSHHHINANSNASVSGSLIPERRLSQVLSQSQGSFQQRRVSVHEDDESIDDAMLVMPLGPAGGGHHHQHSLQSHGQTSSQNQYYGATSAGQTQNPWNAQIQVPYKPRQRKSPISPSSQTQSSASPITPSSARSFHTNTNGFSPSSSTYSTFSRAKSLLSVENSPNSSRKGTIALGNLNARGASGRKSSGSGVAAISVTASGFFAPSASLSDVPPVPPVPPFAMGRRNDDT